MTPELSQKLAAAVDAMPAFPKSVQRILELTRDVNCSPKALVQVIDHDPVVMVKILKVVNSAYYALPRKITSINHAVVHLGFNAIKNLALSIAAIGMLPPSKAAGFDAQQYLLHSLSTAGLARKIALRLDDADPMDCFTAGLLHDFGKAVFAQFMPEEFGQALSRCQASGESLHQVLQQTLGVDHAVVGAMLAEKWRFAPPLVETIRNQHGASLRDTEMVACVFAANQISKKLAFGSGGNPCIEALTPAMERRLGGDLDQLVTKLGDLTQVFDEAQIFAKL
jgi:putative nucleotidyltransferase with HDIG domain